MSKNSRKSSDPFREIDPIITQPELELDRQHEPDRNSDKGGRSFYFFDFDDNICNLSTRITIFHKETREEVDLSTAEFVAHEKSVGKSGPYKDYEIDLDPRKGSYRRFRDLPGDQIRSLFDQPFIQDLAHALKGPDHHWKGPSWPVFHYAVFNQRPLSIITARGHHPLVIKEGLNSLYKLGLIENLPNYLAVFPVSHPSIRRELDDPEFKLDVPTMKKRAIIHSVETAMEVYGQNPHHRFGMSDDDPKNVALVLEAMQELKKTYPENAFYVFEARGGDIIRHEVTKEGVEDTDVTEALQPSLFQKS